MGSQAAAGACRFVGLETDWGLDLAVCNGVPFLLLAARELAHIAGLNETLHS
jgi:hypothetical protein